MKNYQEILTEFSEMGARHYFQLQSGEEHEGWIVAVEDGYLLLVDANSQLKNHEFKVRFPAIDMGSLAYRDDENKCWVGVLWQEKPGSWSEKARLHDEVEAEIVPPPPPEASVSKPRRFWNR